MNRFRIAVASFSHETLTFCPEPTDLKAWEEGGIRYGPDALETDSEGKESLRWVGREDGMKVAFDSEPYASFWLKAAVAVMRLLPIEPQL